MFLAFAAAIRTGTFTRCGQVAGHQTVATTLRHVAQTFVLDGQPDPRKDGPGQELSLAFKRLFAAYRSEDPAPKPELALPVSVFLDIIAHEGASGKPKEQALADLIVMAFFCLIRVGEYTLSARSRQTRTVIRRKDLQFWHTLPDGRQARLDHRAPYLRLAQAAAVTLTLDNQKNGARDAMIHHYAVPDNPLCPVKAAARRFSQVRLLRPHDPNTPLSLYSATAHVTGTLVRDTLRKAAFRTMLWLQGYDLARVGSHSIRSSGAM